MKFTAILALTVAALLLIGCEDSSYNEPKIDNKTTTTSTCEGYKDKIEYVTKNKWRCYTVESYDRVFHPHVTFENGIEENGQCVSHEQGGKIVIAYAAFAYQTNDHFSSFPPAEGFRVGVYGTIFNCFKEDTPNPCNIDIKPNNGETKPLKALIDDKSEWYCHSFGMCNMMQVVNDFESSSNKQNGGSKLNFREFCSIRCQKANATGSGKTVFEEQFTVKTDQITFESDDKFTFTSADTSETHDCVRKTN